MADILTNFSPYHNRVQEGMTDGRFMNAAYTVIAAGPPRLSNMGGNDITGALLQYCFSLPHWHSAELLFRSQHDHL